MVGNTIFSLGRRVSTNIFPLPFLMGLTHTFLIPRTFPRGVTLHLVVGKDSSFVNLGQIQKPVGICYCFVERDAAGYVDDSRGEGQSKFLAPRRKRFLPQSAADGFQGTPGPGAIGVRHEYDEFVSPPTTNHIRPPEGLG